MTDGIDRKTIPGTPTAAETPTFKCAVNEGMKSTELPLLRLGGTVQENPHLRAFWASTCSFFIAFVGWFATIMMKPDLVFVKNKSESIHHQFVRIAEHYQNYQHSDFGQLVDGFN